MYENVIADRMSRLGTESAFGILAEAQSLEAQGKSIIHMEIGQPDFNTPQNIIDAACKALNDGYTGYAPTPGYPILRQTIADYCKKYKHIDVTKEQVVVVPGGKPIMFYTMLLLVNKGDEVIYPNPGFPIYESCVNFVGGKAVPMPLLAKNNFKIDLELLEKSITDKTKLIIINNPSNPTGGVLTGTAKNAAARFSFMMSAPAILGSLLMEGKDALEEGYIHDIELVPTLVGILVACAAGFLAIRLMLKIISRVPMGWFALYLAVIGIVYLLLQLTGNPLLPPFHAPALG